MEKIETINFHEVKEVAGIKFWCYHAGHVLGAAMFMIEIAGVKVCIAAAAPAAPRSIFFSGLKSCVCVCVCACVRVWVRVRSCCTQETFPVRRTDT